MIYVIAAGIFLIFVLAVAVGLIDARNAPRWREIAADRRRAWESLHSRDDYPTGPQPLPGRR